MNAPTAFPFNQAKPLFRPLHSTIAATSGPDIVVLLRRARTQLCAVAESFVADVAPLWCARSLRARVVRVDNEAPGVKSIYLQPSVHWQGFEAGQCVPLTIEQNGVLHKRYYSISNSPEEYQVSGLIRLTVKAVQTGCVSQAVNNTVKTGDILGLGSAQGEFTLRAAPEGLHEGVRDEDARRRLFIAAGSGITPIMSMLESLYAHYPLAQTTLLYCVRKPADVIFKNRLQAMANQYPGFRFLPFFSATQGRLSQQDMAGLSESVCAEDMYLCGPTGFRQSVLSHLSVQGLDASAVQQESFGLGVDAAEHLQHERVSGEVHFVRSGKTIGSSGSDSLLVLAERAGLQPKFGCRSGICHECSCERGEGALRDLRTGQLIDASQQRVQACIAAPQGHVRIADW
ncbi:MAG: iron-sulfur cluster-binding domain-containing protein [Oleiphilaceae bacterium]|nr:iron-sulfur cluster-binding domain-containing protein [Oleiphilaceae bacterium]